MYIYVYVYIYICIYVCIYIYICVLFLKRIYTFVVCILTISHECVSVIILAPLSLSLYIDICVDMDTEYGVTMCYVSIYVYTPILIYICNIDIHYL